MKNNNNLEELREKISNIPQGLGVEETIKIGSKILGNPLFAFDLCYNLLTYHLERPTDDWLINELVTLGKFSHEAVNFFNEENFITAYNESDTVSFLQSDKLKYRRMNGKLFDKDAIQIGDVSFAECYRPFLDGEDTVFELLCEKVSIELQNSRLMSAIPRVFGDSALSDVLEGNETISTELAASLENCFSTMKKNIFVSAIDISGYDGTMTHIAYFRQKLEELCPEFKFFVGLQSIIAFFSCSEQQLDLQTDLSKLNSFFCENRIFAGVSKPIKSVKSLKASFRKAIRALNRGLQKRHKSANIFLS